MTRQYTLGKLYSDGEIIIRQGAADSAMYVIQSGEVEVVQAVNGGEQELAVLEAGDFFGEMSMFEQEPRSATVRARGEARILRVDKSTLMRRIREDPMLAVNLLKTMAHRIRDLDTRLSRYESRP